MRISLDTSIEEIVNKKIATLHPKDSIERAKEIFERTNRKLIPVVSNHEIKGILFKQNFKAIDKANKFFVKFDNQLFDISPMRAEDFMNTDFKVLSIRVKLIDALKFFTEHRQYYIPIVDVNKFIGLVTPFDLFNYLIDLHQFDNDFSH